VAHDRADHRHRTADGQSGIIDFGTDGSQVPLDKFVAVMRVDRGGSLQVQATCGAFANRSQAPWCP
jgi:hypothetical protein